MGLRRNAIKLMGRAHRALYRVTGGRVLGVVAGMPVLILTTTGRRSGRLRSTPLTYFEHGDDLVVVASNGGDDRAPGWWLNLLSEPRAVVTIARTSHAVHAREATPAERDRLWPAITSTYPGYAGYARRTTRRIPVVVLVRVNEKKAPSR